MANRLAKLEALGILHKGKLPDNKKTVIYSLTQKGIELLPIIVDMILWSDNNLGDHVDDKMRELAKKIRLDKEVFINNYTAHLQALMAAP